MQCREAMRIHDSCLLSMVLLHKNSVTALHYVIPGLAAYELAGWPALLAAYDGALPVRFVYLHREAS